MIQSNEVGHVLSKAVFTESIRSQIEVDLLSYGCDAEIVDEVSEKALSNEFIDILDILEDTDRIDIYQAAELVKDWFGESAIFTSYHIYLTDARKRMVRDDLHELGVLDKDLEVFELLRKAEVKKLYSYLKRYILIRDKEEIKDMIIRWTGDSSFRISNW